MVAFNNNGAVWILFDSNELPPGTRHIVLSKEPEQPPKGHHWEIDWVAEKIVNVPNLSELTPIENLQQENQLLRAQVQAMGNQYQFLEDCIAEMAAQVY